MKNFYESIPQPPSSPGLLPLLLTSLLAFSWMIHAAFVLLREESEEVTPTLLHLLPPSLIILVLLATFLLVARYLQGDNRKQQAPQPSGQPALLAETDCITAPGPAEGRNVFIVHTATQSVPIEVTDICCFFREGRHNFLRTFDRCDYLLPESLREVQQALDSHLFFRVNRQLIIHRRACRSFRPAANGKLELTLLQPLPFPAVVSQLKAARFRRWIKR